MTKLEREIKKILGEEVPFQELNEKLKDLDWFGSGLKTINLETKVDGNGYYKSIRIYRDSKGHDRINVAEIKRKVGNPPRKGVDYPTRKNFWKWRWIKFHS